jgi:hypothetical protein
MFAACMSEKRVGGMALVADCLPTKCETLSSNSTTVKKIVIIGQLGNWTLDAVVLQ